jgi:hypothetical protein
MTAGKALGPDEEATSYGHRRRRAGNGRTSPMRRSANARRDRHLLRLRSSAGITCRGVRRREQIVGADMCTIEIESVAGTNPAASSQYSGQDMHAIALNKVPPARTYPRRSRRHQRPPRAAVRGQPRRRRWDL